MCLVGVVDMSVMWVFATSSLGVLAVLLTEGAALFAWLTFRWGYPAWRSRRERRLVARARAQGLVDSGFSDRRVLEPARADLASLAGRHPLDDRDDLDALLGDGPGDWILAHCTQWKHDHYQVEATACDVVRVLDRGEDGPARVVVRVQIRISVSGTAWRHSAVAFWTFTLLDGVWTRTAVEDEWAGRRHVAQDPLRSPEANIARLHDRAVLEQASQDSAPVALSTSVGDLVGAREASAAALDLAVIDGRYRLDAIESCLHRLLAAWELATNGEPTALGRLAEPHAADQLLRPERGLPGIIREPHLRKFRLAELNTSVEPPQITVIASLQAHPDMWHLDICWRLTLADHGELPWILSDANAWTDSYLYPAH